MSATEAKRRALVSAELQALPIYHRSLPLSEIDAILVKHGFKPTAEGIFCGREGRMHEQVGERTFIVMTWYKMEVTGNYEVVAYV